MGQARGKCAVELASSTLAFVHIPINSTKLPTLQQAAPLSREVLLDFYQALTNNSDGMSLIPSRWNSLRRTSQGTGSTIQPSLDRKCQPDAIVFGCWMCCQPLPMN